MSGERSKATLRRALKAARLLADAGRAGVRAKDAAKELGASLSTFYRYLEKLGEAGLASEKYEQGGERRIRLTREQRLPALGPDLEQRLALTLLRAASPSLAGSFAERAVAELLGEEKESERALKGFRKTGPASDTLDAISRAIRTHKCLRFYYRGARDGREQERLVEPIELRLVQSQVYLVAYDLEREEPRTFKPLRMSRAFVCPEAAQRRQVDVDALFGKSVRVWSGAPVEVSVRIAADKARFLTEWPLHSAQKVEIASDGTATVNAQVAGLVEVTRWVLSWGPAATVLAPGELRRLVITELEGALAGYRGEKVQERRAGVSRGS